jgi:hypothetical protein
MKLSAEHQSTGGQMISPEDKAKLLKFLAHPTSNLPSWVVIVIRHFIEESDENEKRLIELDETLAETVMRYEEQLSFLRVLLAYSDWYQNEEGEWVRKIAEEKYQGMAVADRHLGQNYP